MLASLNRGDTECAGCGIDISKLNKTTRLLDEIIDELVIRVDHVTMPEMVDKIIDGINKYQIEMRRGHLGEVPAQEAALAIQIRCLQIIWDLREAIRTGHG